MQRSSIIQQRNQSDNRAKTPQNKNELGNKARRETQSLAKTSVSNHIILPNSTTKIQQKTNLVEKLKLQSIQQNSFSNKLFYLGKGNNHQIVRKILLRRKNWVQTENKEQFYHFKWSQSTWGFKYHLLGKMCLCFNHFEYHREISNKQRLVRNMINYCQTNKLNAFSYVPLTYIIDLTSGQEDMALHNFLKFYNRNLPPNSTQRRLESIILPRIKHHGYNSTPNNQSKRPQGLFYCQPMMHKTFVVSDEQTGKSPYLWILKPTFMNRGRGVALFNSLEQFEKLIWKYYQGQDLQDYGNRTFNMEDFEMDQHQEDKLHKKTQKNVEQHKIQIKIDNAESKSQQKSTPSKILKQGNKNLQKQNENTNKIQLSTKRPSIQKVSFTNHSPSTQNNYHSLNNKSLTKKESENSNGLKVLSFVVQKYIESPMLINQRKFDIRVWAMLTQNYEIFFYKEGYLRFSSFKYSTKHHTNPFIHLTNNSVQKHSSQYNEQSGNQMYLSDMKSYMPQQSYLKLQSKIRENIWISMISARRKINVNGRKECFEIFGYDFMVDSQFKVWLIEINTNPAIEDCSTVLKAMIPRMLDDGFKLTFDKIFNNKLKQNIQVFPVVNFRDQENMWQLLGDFRQGINEKTMGKKLSFLRR